MQSQSLISAQTNAATPDSGPVIAGIGAFGAALAVAALAVPALLAAVVAYRLPERERPL